MRILLTIHHDLDPNSGAPGSVLKLGQTYQQLGHEVTYYSFNTLPHFIPGWAKALMFPEFLAGSMWHSLVQPSFDVIDASTGDAWIWGSLMRRFIQKPPLLITRSHGLEHSVHLQNLEDASQGNLTLSWKYPLYHGGFRLWEVATSLRCADLVFLLNHQDLKYATEKLGIDSANAYVCPNGIPDAFLNLPFESVSPEPSMLGIAVIGTYIQRKGIQYSVPALNTILQRYPHVFVSFLGTGCPPEQVYAEFEPVVRDRIRVMPHFKHAELPALLKGHAIKLFVPLAEGFGKALIEAMACGLAPITTATAGPLEIVHDGHDALVIPLRSSIAIERALDQLIGDRPYLEQLRRNAYTTAQTYSWLNTAQQRLQLYEQGITAKCDRKISSSNKP